MSVVSRIYGKVKARAFHENLRGILSETRSLMYLIKSVPRSLGVNWCIFQLTFLRLLRHPFVESPIPHDEEVRTVASK